MVWLDRFLNVGVALWIGSMWATMAIVAPILFQMLERGVAGAIAGRLFAIQAVVGIAMGAVALLRVMWLGEFRRRHGLAIAAMWVCSTLQGLVLQPLLARFRGSSMFVFLHGTSAVLFLTMGCLGLYLLFYPGRIGSSRTARA